jgi:acetolactate decarboxylase
MAEIWQNAPAIALENGCYDGITEVGEVRRHGNQGIGAFDQLDGEMVGVDGTFYRMTEDSVAHVAADDETLPFCMVTQFGGGSGEPIELPPDMRKDSLYPWLDSQVEQPNLFYALRIEGRFHAVRSRCMPRQHKPFPALKEVEKVQTEYAYERLEATMVGFRAPSYVGRTSPPSWHLHFVSADRSFGGHVIAFEGCDARISLERIDRQEILYPTASGFGSKQLA